MRWFRHKSVNVLTCRRTGGYPPIGGTSGRHVVTGAFGAPSADDKASCIGDPPELTVTTVERGTFVVSTAGKRSTAWFGWMTMLQRVRERGGLAMSCQKGFELFQLAASPNAVRSGTRLLARQSRMYKALRDGSADSMSRDFGTGSAVARLASVNKCARFGS